VRYVGALLLVTACSTLPSTGKSPTSAPSATPVTTTASTGPAAPATPSPPPEATADRVLLVVTGFGSARTNVATADLVRDYCNGTISVLEPVRAAADRRFGCRAPSPLASSSEFLPMAKRQLLVTDLGHVTSQFRAVSVEGTSFFEHPSAYPLVLAEAAGGSRPDYAPHLTHLIMTGVTAVTRGIGTACEKHGPNWLTARLRASFAPADYVHVSNEVSFDPSGILRSEKTYARCTTQALLDLHANVVELTGNHTRDYGDARMAESIDWYKAHHMATFGGGATPEAANEPILLALADGKQLGMIGFNETCPLHECAMKTGEVGANAYEPKKARVALKRMREELRADTIIATVQFREWDNAEPTGTQTAIAHTLIEEGADLVFGSQAHQLQLVEFYHGKPIFHGLGNLIYDQIHRLGVRQAFFLHHYFYGGRLVQSVPVFTFMSDSRQPTLATPEQAEAMKTVVYRDDLLYR
jgi:hypothetical protein